MRIKFIMGMLLSTILFTNFSVSAKTNLDVKDELLNLNPNMTSKELDQLVKEVAISNDQTEDMVLNQILNELKFQQKLTEEEKRQIETRPMALYTLDSAKNYGDIFYEPANYLWVQHGHVGIYWSRGTIVESVPDQVRALAVSNKTVETGSKIFTFSPSISLEQQDKASNWAYSRIGDPYSDNFLTNRETSHYGAKNCSKLVWSAYLLMTGIDIDSNGGWGVYPKDILNNSMSQIYKSY